jgi:transposase
MHGGGGAPRGNKNAFKHGSFTAEAIETQLVIDMRAEWQDLDHRIATLNAEFVALVRSDAAAQRLMTIPGIGVLNATALVAAVGDAMVLGVLGHPLFASVF